MVIKIGRDGHNAHISLSAATPGGRFPFNGFPQHPKRADLGLQTVEGPGGLRLCQIPNKSKYVRGKPCQKSTNGTEGNIALTLPKSEGICAALKKREKAGRNLAKVKQNVKTKLHFKMSIPLCVACFADEGLSTGMPQGQSHFHAQEIRQTFVAGVWGRRA
ncbi:hypothetical protein CEXT_124611 [Caerostris extrusa]|uniref:Uncharacterized protein n=1 Tax=Caerostris extrusa TaxID=172846 RepID=A0AAV4X3V6_CAEEX|nr:hypothetical protein CEXT_124611 [Caerostris extrusa]